MDLVKNIGISGFIDMLFITFIIYSLLVWLKKTQARFILTGILIIGAIYLFSQQFNLIITSIILKAFFAVILVAILIIFQKELRQLFEQVAIWSLKKSTGDKRSKLISYSAVEILTRCLDDFAKDKIGALVVLPAKDKIDGFLDGGIELDGKLSEELIKSLFDPHSTGHDGAVVIENGIVKKFSCHLPLSQNFSQLQKKGTRHAAALGLAEETDALCLVVSEERGEISIARNSNLMKVTPEQLQVHLQDYYSEIIPDTGNSKWKEYFSENNREKALALLVSAVLWFVFVHESRLVYRYFTVPINNIVVSSELKVSKVIPESIDVMLAGSRRDFIFFRATDIKLYIKLPDASIGTQAVNVSPSDFFVSEKLDIEKIEPQNINIYITKNSKNTK